ncbi:MAG: hypothetical protein AB8B72_11590 [Crocinitomicaceae bacterium]
MKQFKLIFGLFAFTLILSSCTTNWVCECVTFINEEEQPKIDNTYPIEDVRKQQAIKDCNDWDSTEVSLNFVRTTTNCELQ